MEWNMQADLWSVGAILFQLVTGKTPFTGSNQIQVWLALLFHMPKVVSHGAQHS
jgi:serine/threonine protein kinase